ncbi:MAG: flagellar biosynthesis protein FlhF [Spirochaetae bacterium HGW-Spirochaetae-3]|jgi:flagellar biosynthesis protein FlhF|nr:MAG: flagellar biosynthesis protein FlhF [Spirochaetae bacterium HGW-Spirochaetae-3]
MQYLVEQGSSHREVLEKVRARYGDAAQVLSHRTVRSGGFLGMFAREGVEITFYLKDDAVREGEKKKADIEDEKRKLLERVSQERALQEVLSEVRSLKVSIAESAARPAPVEAEHPTLSAIDALLCDNDFSPWYRSELFARAHAEFSLDALEDYEAVEQAVLEWIGDTVRIPTPPRPVKPRVLVLVGPTGVGKTTTIAKLAALHSLGIGGLPAGTVRMITIDSYRIGAVEQIEKYAGIMRVPVSVVETAQHLRETIAMYRDTDLILVDTIGKSPRDAVKLAEMQQILDACGPSAEVYLAIAATTKTQDMFDIFRQFEPFRYRGVVVTKMDETGRVGNVLSVLAETDKAVAWVTDGQKVPQDIAPAHPLRFLMNLEGFRPNRPKLEERYGLIPR